MPVGFTVGLYRIQPDRSVLPVVIDGCAQVLGTHKEGAAALVGVLAEAVGAISAPAGSA